jgi:hypothetical protein
VIAGCGGSSALPRFIARADRICARAGGELATLAPAKQTVRGYTRAARAQIAVVEREIAALSALHPPSAQRPGFRALLADARADVSLAREEIDELRAGDHHALHQLIAQSRALDARTQAATSRLRLRRCP